MPQTYSALNTDGTTYVPADVQFAAQQRARQMSDYLAMAQLSAQERMHGQDLASHGLDRSSMERVQGDFTDRAASDANLAGIRNTGMTDVASIGALGNENVARLSTQPALIGANLATQEYNDQAPQRAVGNKLADIRSHLLDSVDQQVAGSLAGGGQPGGVAPAAAGGSTGSIFGANDIRSLARGAMGLGEDPDVAAARQMKATLAAKYVDALSSPRPEVRQYAQQKLSELGIAGFPAGGSSAGAPGGMGSVPPALNTPPIDPKTIEDAVNQQLPGYVYDDTSSWWSRGLKGAGVGATGGGVGGAFVGGLGAIPGAAIGGAAGFLGGALSSRPDPNQDQQDQLVQLYMKLAQAYTDQTGDPKLGQQLALTKFRTIAQSDAGGQGNDYLTDVDADKTRALFQRIAAEANR